MVVKDRKKGDDADIVKTTKKSEHPLSILSIFL
jgi:hypothetical protein